MYSSRYPCQARTMVKYFSTSLWYLTAALFLCCLSCIFAIEVSYDGRAIKLDGQRRILISGSIHYPRSTPEMWPSLIKKAKEGGLNVIDTYIFWNIHEPLYRQYDFSGNLDFVRFFKTIQQEGLYAILRVGPYVSAEFNFGGFPAWLLSMPNMTFRTMNDAFLDEVKTFTTFIIDIVKKEKLFAPQGGPIILAQIENEYGDINSAYGKDAKLYVDWCANFAESLNIGVPWIMCQEPDAPKSMITACNGFYCDQFRPSNSSIPMIWAENWTGWYKGWGGWDPHRTAEDTAFAVTRFYQYGGTLQNYYMYHGGTNFGRIAGGPYIATSYDYDGILDEYGNRNQPKWGHLKQLHFLLISLEEILTHGVVTNTDFGNMMDVSMYAYNGTRICFFANANETDDMTIKFEGYNYTIPAWSVSILHDCRTEVYNTARVNSQTSVMVKEEKKDDQPMEWKWKVEPFEQVKIPWKGFSSPQLLDQKVATNDTSDYLWYMTSVEIEENDPIWGEEVKLQVNSSGHILHVFVNGEHLGSHIASHGVYQFIFEQIVKMKNGQQNNISLLSVTAGLPNYGAYFDKKSTGVLGPVKLFSPNSQVMDLSFNQWAYKVGLNGIDKGYYKGIGHNYYQTWNSMKYPVNKMFVWYQTTFKTPSGEDPVVLDLLGLGKGMAWVNGQNIGRYWPSFITYKKGCNLTHCDYRGRYNTEKCMTNCGGRTQRWYHVPRSFLRDGENILVLFEEVGGNPSGVNVQTVTVGKACGNAYEGNSLELSCQGGKTISEIRFASFGDPKGGCRFFEKFEKGECDSPDTISSIRRACVGKRSCTIDVSEKNFEPNSCRNITKRLAVEAVC